MVNHLANENSPYLLQHVNNPVDWFPWGPEALEKARLDDKPIFLSIGYAACHWCHVMAHESFENPDIALLLNENFVNIKVDREERPDIDNIYMSAVVAMTGQGGWPMSVFLTPDGQPFYAGTYFPPTPRFGIPSFLDVINAIIQAWQQKRKELIISATEISRHIANSGFYNKSSTEPNPNILVQSTQRLIQTYDWEHGGWGSAPKFPQPMTIMYLLQQASNGNQSALEVAQHALIAMAQGGIYDVIGGGFSRYSTDAYWLVPHFEKMLYDNALLARSYLQCYLLTKNEALLRICEETLDFIIRELMFTKDDIHPSVGFYSSLDADSEGVEGKFYLWTVDQIQAAIQSDPSLDSTDYALFSSAYAVNKQGNFDGKIILRRAKDDHTLADQFQMDKNLVMQRLSKIQNALLRLRNTRIRPATDDKILTGWNSLALITFAEAARYLNRQDFLLIAQQNARFIIENLYSTGTLHRSWRCGKSQHIACLEDHAGLILALIALYQVDPNNLWFRTAIQLMNDLFAHYMDSDWGFFDTHDEQTSLIFRPKDIQDNATPSGNALAALALLQLSSYTGNMNWYQLAYEALEQIQNNATRHPTAFAQWLIAFGFALNPIQEIAIIGDRHDQRTEALINTIVESFQPFTLVAISNYPPEADAPPLVHERQLLNNSPTAYLCQRFVCHQPVNTPAELIYQLKSQSTRIETGQ